MCAVALKLRSQGTPGFRHGHRRCPGALRHLVGPRRGRRRRRTANRAHPEGVAGAVPNPIGDPAGRTQHAELPHHRRRPASGRARCGDVPAGCTAAADSPADEQLAAPAGALDGAARGDRPARGLVQADRDPAQDAGPGGRDRAGGNRPAEGDAHPHAPPAGRHGAGRAPASGATQHRQGKDGPVDARGRRLGNGDPVGAAGGDLSDDAAPVAPCRQQSPAAAPTGRVA